MGRREHRKYRRTTFIFPVRIAVKQKGKGRMPGVHFHAFSDNISEGGLKITLKEELEVGTPLELRFDLILQDQIHMVETNAVIRWCKKIRRGLYEYGFLFDDLSRKNWNTVTAFMKEYCVSNA